MGASFAPRRRTCSCSWRVRRARHRESSWPPRQWIRSWNLPRGISISSWLEENIPRPCLPVFDTHALCTRADAVVLVARSGQTSRHEVKHSVELIEKINGKVTGVVLNDVDLKSQPGQYYGNYTY